VEQTVNDKEFWDQVFLNAFRRYSAFISEYAGAWSSDRVVMAAASAADQALAERKLRENSAKFKPTRKADR